MRLSWFRRSHKVGNVAAQVTMRQYASLLAIYLGPQWLRVCCMAFLLLASIGLQLLGPQIIRTFIDTVQHGGDLHVLTGMALLFLGVSIGGRLVSALATYFSEDVGWHATNRLRSDLVLHCLQLDRSFHSTRTPGELIERVDGDVNALASFFSQFVIRIVGNALLALGALVLIARENVWIGIIMSVYIGLAVVAFVRVQIMAKPSFHAMRQASAEMSGFFGELLSALEDIAASGAAQYIMRRYFLLQRISNRTHIQSSFFWAAYENVWMVIDIAGDVLVLTLGAYFFTHGTLSIGAIVLLLGYLTQLNNNTGEISDQFGSLQEATASIERINELYHITRRVQDGPGVEFPAGALKIEFQHVDFYYETAQQVLFDLSFVVEPGEVVGLIGRSGSGKTTLTRLLMRFYDPVAGTVHLGGQELRLAHVDDLRKHIGVVTQDVQLFQATLRENLTFFDETILDAHIINAIERLGISAWYERLPQGLDTPLSSNGQGLSAGEAQLLACVRVFLHDPQLIILDEASSRLDPATEALITHATNQLLVGRTGVIIAHRLVTVEHVDRIMVLEAGRIVEYGRREQLACDAGSRYSQLLKTANPEELLI